MIKYTLRLFLFLLIIFSPLSALAQSTTVTATITDSDSIAWANATYQINFVQPAGNSQPAVWNGTLMTSAQKQYSGTLNGSGALSVSIPDTSFINPPGALWNFIICPNASASCSQYRTAVTGASLSLTSQLSAAVVAPRFPASGANAYGYSTVEINQIPVPGGFFWNVTSGCQDQWNGSAFACTSGGSSGFPIIIGSTSIASGSTTTSISGLTLVAPVLGTPMSATLTNATGLPISTGVSGLGTGVATALAANVSGTGAICLASGSACSGGSASISFPQTVAGTTVSGGITYFSSPTVLSSSALLTTNVLIKGGGAGNPPIPSSITDNGTTVTIAEPVAIGSACTIASGGSWCAPGSSSGTITFAVPAAAGTNTVTFPAATATLTYTVANGTSALGTGAISSGACATVVTTTATGAAATDNIMADFNADPTSTTGYSPSSSGMLTIIKYPTSGNVNFKVCNNTAGSITPGAVTLNWRVVR